MMSMITGHVNAALLPAARSVRRWLFHLGGLGLIPLGLLDNSPIPVPGAMDVATIVLSARQQQLWLYYALMATVGSLIGGFVTYRLARRGGKEALEHRFSRRTVDKVCKFFGRWGFGVSPFPLCCRRPCPWSPFCLRRAPCSIRQENSWPRSRRPNPRYMLLAYLAARYGRQIIAFIAAHGHPAILAIIMALIASAALVLYFWRGSKSRKRA